MNVLLWIVQIVLALLTLSGGAYKVFACGQLAKMPATAGLPAAAWAAIGAFEIVCAILLVVPRFTRQSAIALAIESLALALFYARTSLSMTATNPLVWVIVIGAMAAFVAYGRSARRAR